LVLGGVEFKRLPALKGHSDGDALIHAVIDSLLGAAGLGDIGDMFPDTASEWKGVSSRIFLEKVNNRIERRGFVSSHIDVTVVAKKPRLSEVKGEIKKIISNILRLPPSSINIKGKTPEGLSLFKGDGVAVWSVATLIHS